MKNQKNNKQLLELRVNQAIQFYNIDDVQISNGRINVICDNVQPHLIDEATQAVAAAFTAYFHGHYSPPIKLSDEYTKLINMSDILN